MRFGIAGMAVFGAVAGTLVLCGAVATHGGEELEFDSIRLFIEFNDTDQDVGIQAHLGGDPWRRLRVYNPHGRKIIDIIGRASLRKQGYSELFFESAEPSLKEVPLEEFLERFPEGEYEFEGVTIDGKKIDGEAMLTHAIPEGPEIIVPQEDSEQDPGNTIVVWDPVPDPPGSEITAYQVIVTQEIEVEPKREFSVFVPASVSMVTVPAEFMEAGAEYELEVLAIEAGGNQTISALFFYTSE